MANKTWLGGGNNEASNPADWTPAGVPVAGDDVRMSSGTISNIDGINFAGGSPLLVVDSNVDTINLSHDATAFVDVIGASINTINIFGDDNLLVQLNGSVPASATSVDLAKNSHWVGGFVVTDQGGPATLIVNGGKNATFENAGVPGRSGSIDEGQATAVEFNTDVTGRGQMTFSNGALLQDISGSVSAGQTINLEGPTPSFAVLYEPKDFHGLIDLGMGQVDLLGIKADSYTYKNDLLSIFNGKTVVDTLRLAASQFTVSQSLTGVGVVVWTTPDVGTGGTILPVHV